MLLILLGAAAIAAVIVGLVVLQQVGPTRSLSTGLLYALGRLYARVVHGLRVEGREHVPSGRESPGPMIIVANHTAGIDPLLIGSACPFEIRWIMAEDMRLPSLEWFWRWQRVIFVAREGMAPRGGRGAGGGNQDGGGGNASLREALRHLEGGGVIGIFPEGGIERPPRQILPFMRGLGLLIARSKATVLPVLVDGTPQVDPAWASLWRPSRSRLRFLPAVEYGPALERRSMKSSDVLEDLRQRFLDASGWPANDNPLPVEHATLAQAARQSATPKAGGGDGGSRRRQPKAAKRSPAPKPNANPNA